MENTIEAPTLIPQKRAYNKAKNGKKIGRPTDKSEEEMKANRRTLEREYSIRRGRFITKINYYINKYEIPQELQDLPQDEDENVKNKCKAICSFVVEKQFEITRTRKPKTFIKNNIDSETDSN
jgi:hypothetical protein